MEEKYLTVDELREWLKISRSTVDRWRKQGMPFIKRDRLIRFNKQKVVEWLERKNGTQN